MVQSLTKIIYGSNKKDISMTKLYTNMNLEAAVRDLEEAEIGKRNKELVLKFHHDLLAEGLSELRVIKYVRLLKRIAEWLGKDFDKAEEGDIRRVVAQIEKSELQEWTKQNYKVAIKRFYRWLYKLPPGKDPEITEWIRTTVKNNGKKLPEDLLSEDEVKAMIDATPHTRDKALIAVLWDAGLRVGEAGSLKVKNVIFDDYGAVLVVHGKTGYRRVRVIWAVPYLMDWLEQHPLKDDPEAPLWVKIWNGKTEAMNYYGIRKQIQTAAKKAGIKKRIHPHIFRHSRATYLAKHLTEAQMKEYFGWTQSSDMAAVYVHLSGRDVDDAILKLHGLKKDEEEEKPKPKKCPRCKQINPTSAYFCVRCGAVLDLQAAIKQELIMSEVAAKEKIVQEIKELVYKEIIAELKGKS